MLVAYAMFFLESEVSFMEMHQVDYTLQLTGSKLFDIVIGRRDGFFVFL